jgi:RHS repeat-associated protein
VQGIDHAYTLQGWLKAVNANTLGPDHDMAADASTATDHIHGNVGHDAFGYSLHYYEDDYTPKAAASAPVFLADASGSALATASSPLYNGNISRMVTSVSDFTNSPILGSAFRYDQLNRLVKAVHYDEIASNQWGTTAHSPDKDSDHYSAYFYDANGNIRRLERNAYHSDTTDRKMDRMTYSYPEHSNRLTIVNDTVPDVAWGTDFDDMSEDFQYDLDGRLTVDPSAQIAHIDWNAQGKVRFIGREEGSTKALLVFHYDGMGNRVRKVVVPRNEFGETLPIPEWTFTYYIRDAQGNPLTTLERKLTDIDTEEGWDELHIQETMLYGSDRLGVRNWAALPSWQGGAGGGLIAKRKFTHNGLNDYGDMPTADDYTGSVITSTAPANYARHLEGLKRYELKNHLGNILATVSDKRDAVDDDGDVLYYQPKVTNWKFYYPFGSDMVGLTFNPDDHPFDFNGKPTDRELDDWQDYGERMYLKKLIRFPSPDPLITQKKEYPWYSPYQFAGGKPILAVDLDGLEEFYYGHSLKDKTFGVAKDLMITTDAGIKAYMEVWNSANKPVSHDVYFVVTDFSKKNSNYWSSKKAYGMTKTFSSDAVDSEGKYRTNIMTQAQAKEQGLLDIDFSLSKRKGNNISIIYINCASEAYESAKNGSTEGLVHLSETIYHELKAHVVAKIEKGSLNSLQSEEHKDYHGSESNVSPSKDAKTPGTPRQEYINQAEQVIDNE